MSIVRAYEVIERVIVSEMIDILRYDGEETIEEWADDRRERFNELNNFVISTLGYNNRRVVQSVQESIAEAERLISEHIQEQWEFDDVQHNTDEQAEQAIIFLNENIQQSLISVFPRVGTVEQLYNRVIDLALEDDSDNDIDETLYAIMLSALGGGLYTGYVQSDGVRWRLDRYVNQVERSIFTEVYSESLANTLKFHGVELVKVHKYVKPRDACADLQASGTICIVPRDQASDEAKQYPNIHDPQHMYLAPGGHHGSDGNCRHQWHHINSQKNMAEKLYESLDANLLMLEVKRMQFMNAVRNWLGGD